ncbi:OmpP1/FadL family transporter [Pontibacter chitinilyticus]|uniref:OmpP1/FadL family transporter n=1 Tax=Pontibacter chitinilyticus TaxID=2674989 RepID=UPI003219198A
MKMYKILSASLALLLGWSGTAFAQNEVDALRYTRLGLSGTARIQGIGGAQTALGADISSMTANPAGLGMFRRSEFSITPGLQFSTTEAGINGATTSDARNILAIPQAGLVLSRHKGDEEEGDWRGSSLGISFTRLNNFNQQLNYRNTTQPPNTIVDYFSDRAFGRTQSDLDAEYGNFTTLEGLAYGNYLINFQDENGTVTPDARPLYSLGDIDQQEQIQRIGSQSQFDIGIGTSYKDKIYLGASLGVITTNFTQKSTFLESGHYIDTFNEDGSIALEGDYNLDLYDEFTSEAAGVNLRVGVIARPVDALRIGLSIQTPTAYTFTDRYQTTLNSTSVDPDTKSPANYSSSIVPGEFTYQLTTPFRANGGVAVFLNKYGFISADVEFVDYSKTRFHEQQDEYGNSGNYFNDVNDVIAVTYKSAVNYKIGAEGRYDVFRFRAGYSVSGDPYRNANFDGKVNTYSLGAGIRLKNYYLDAAYVNSTGDSRYSPYTFSSGGGEPVVDLNQKQSSVLVTFGYNF